MYVAFKTYKMRKTFVILVALTGASCVRTMYIPSDTVVRYVEHDVLRDTTIYITLEHELTRNETFSDSSHLETTYALSDAKVDSNNKLTHTLVNKNVEIPKTILYKDKDRWRDSIVYKTLPPEVITEVKIKYRYNGVFWLSIAISTLLILWTTRKIWTKLV